LLPRATCVREVRATLAGFVERFDAEQVGRAAMLLGAGRAKISDTIDPGAGLVLAVRVGDEVTSGDLLCTMYAADEDRLDAGEERFRHALRLSPERVQPPPLFHQL
jgi:pyrimidine-nucleoside phosphorylase